MKPSLAYLISRYPAISHTFILKEVEFLRGEGLNIEVASINETDISASLQSKQDKEEVENTYYIKKRGVIGAICLCFKTFFLQPRGWMRGFFHAFLLPRWDVAKMVYHLFYFMEALLVLDWMRKKKISHLHVHFGNPAATVAWLIGVIDPKVKYSMTIHGPDEFYDVTLNHLKEKIEGAFFIICISDYAKSQLMKWSCQKQWHKMQVVPLGVETSKFSPFEKKKEEIFRFVSVGRLVAAKGQLILIQAIELIKKQGKKCHLYLVGEGPSRLCIEQELQARGLNEQVTLTGALGQEKVLEIYKQANAFVLASFAEGVPVVLMEAMAMEIPCISTWVNGIPELISEGKTGLLVPPGNAKCLADAMIRLMEDPGLCQNLGQAARKKICLDYQLQVNGHRLKNVFLSQS